MRFAGEAEIYERGRLSKKRFRLLRSSAPVIGTFLLTCCATEFNLILPGYIREELPIAREGLLQKKRPQAFRLRPMYFFEHYQIRVTTPAIAIEFAL